MREKLKGKGAKKEKGNEGREVNYQAIGVAEA